MTVFARLAVLTLMILLPTVPVLAEPLRVATFNTHLTRRNPGELERALRSGTDAQLRRVAEIIQRVRPDILLMNEFDYGAGLPALFVDNYLSVSQGRQAPIAFPHVFTAPSNTGLSSGLDLNRDGKVATNPGSRDYANDAFGFGYFPGQYGMALLSRYPIQTNDLRSFQTFKWADMPGARMPVIPGGGPYYAPEVWDSLRLSSKSHWDVPISVDGAVLHLLASHPTPPIFDDLEDRNGLRNADEIRFWADYIDGASYIYDDRGVSGGLADGALFVILGDLNADPLDGEAAPGAIGQLLDHPAIQADPVPSSTGGVVAAKTQGGINRTHKGPAENDTADFRDDLPGNLRVDYVLPAARVGITASGVFWPEPGAPGADVITASDHRLVWVDLMLP